ncbi:hypothetical protein JXM83_03430 [Candidatus Woesearchaeota archaeon]|nr:hypothetical protein [Candidatus Woesearchaeota archaeon]
MKTTKNVGVLAMLFVVLFAFASLAQAAITIEEVQLNDDIVTDTTSTLVRDFSRDNEVKVEVELVSTTNVKNVQVEAVITGLEHDAEDARDASSVFDMKANVTYKKTLNIALPSRMDMEQTYRLRVRVEDQANAGTYSDYYIYVDSERHSIAVKDVLFSPENEVQAGRALLTEVQLKNTGLKDEEDVKVKVSIPELGVSKTTIMDELDSDDTETTEPMFVRIPDCAAAGTYDVLIAVEYNDGDDMVTSKETITVVESETCKPTTKTTEGTSKTLVSLPAAQDVLVGGSESVYPVLLTNAGDSAKTYNVVVRGVDSWGSFRIEPAMTQVVGAGQTSPVYIYVSAKETATVGDKAFFIEIRAGDETKQLPLTANIVNAESKVSGIKNVLVVGLIVFVVLIVILGLIIGFNKMKGNDDDLDAEDEAGQTYY